MATKRYCPDCKSRIDFHSQISNVTAPNQFRYYQYRCKKCSEAEGRDVIIGIIRKEIPEENFYRDVKIFIMKELRKSG